jgi:hypothetical protein
MVEQHVRQAPTHVWYARSVLLVSDAWRAIDFYVDKLVDQLVAETIERSVRTEKSWWGCEVLRIEDPDGNELLV